MTMPGLGKAPAAYFIDGRTEIELTRDYYQFWQVYTAIDNTVCVRVPTEQLRFFNTDAGLFRGITPEVKGDYTVYEVRNNAKTNELIELSAMVNSVGTVPVWTIGSDKTRYSGQTFYFYSDVTAEENLVTLTADTTAADHADYALSGSLYTATMNLATGEPADNRIPAAYAGVVMGPSGASTDEEGKFILAPQPLVGGTTVRYLLSYNGITAIRETKIAPATAPTETVTYTGDLGGEETAEAIPVTVGAIRVHTNAAGGAHFTSVEVEQVGVLRGILNVVELNGQELTVTLHTDPGGVYVYNEEAYFEHVKGVRLYFQSQLTGEIHGEYSTLPADDGEDGEDPEAKQEHQSAKLTWDPDRNVAVLNIKKLTPEEGGDFEAGDVLMAQLITDKRTMWEKMIALGDAIDHYTVDEKQLKSMVNDLRDYAKKQGYLNGAECFYINTSMQTGIFFNVWSVVQCTDWEEFWYDLKEAFTLNFYEDDGAGQMMALLEDDDRPSYGAAILAAGESGQAEYDPADYVSEGRLRIPAPVDSRWVADEGELMAAFGAVSSKQLMEDAIQHPNSRLLPLRYESGGVTRNSNQFLLVFLSQIENGADGTHPDVLMYSIYDANNDTWTAPRQIQPDGVQDGKPCLVDAGDKLILTWSSVSGENYDAFKAFAAEKDLSIEEAALQYPIEAGKGQEIFCVEFSKASKQFGPIEQLTDDDYDDGFPQAVYDSASGDYIVLYYKTAQDDTLYDDPVQAVLDTAAASPDPEKTYSVLCYMLYNAGADRAGGYRDDSGTAVDVPAGWVRDRLYAKEFDGSMKDFADPVTGEATGLAGFLADYGGQRFLPSPIPAEDASGDPIQTDPPISDMTVCEGYKDLAAFAFTVDTDMSLETTEDRDLFLQFYRFSDHSTYVPIKIAGEQTQKNLLLNGDRKTGHYETYDVVTEVNVGSPRLVRNGGSTFLFWRENSEGLKYLDVSALLSARVLDGEDEAVLGRRKTNEAGGYYFDTADQAALSREGSDHSVYAVREDGSFAVDAMTGKPYAPAVCTVDFGSVLTDPAIHITDYEVISDERNNLYVVWSDTTKKDENAPIVSCDESMALELYATARIAEEDLASADPENPAYHARWSKPYRLTRDNAYNDEVALALSDDGDLLIVHNQYRKLRIDTEEKLLELVASGEREVVNIDVDDYVKGSWYYDSPTSLMLTRFAPVGSVEATQFAFSDDTPVAGQTVEVTAIVENTGLTTAEGFDVTFNECKDGVVTRRILRKSVDTPIVVNTGKKAAFEWTVPADGPEGYSIQAVISEKNGAGSYPPVVTSSAPFVAAPVFELTLESCRQNGDGFDAVYTVANTGNKAAKEGTEANLYLQGLYGDLKEKYGVDDACLVREDISGLQPGEVRTVERSFPLPVSVFRYCGFDAVQAVVYDSGMNALEHTDHLFITLDEPLNLTLNGGQDVSVATGGTAVAPAVYESTLFMDMGNENATKVVYTVDDPSIAAVDDEGRVTGLSTGTTTLTATLLPSGRTKSVRVKVDTGCRRDESCPISRFSDAQPTAWYHDGVHWALEKGVMNGVGNGRFAPNASTTRAMLVTMLWRMEGEPASGYVMTFKDVPAGQ